MVTFTEFQAKLREATFQGDLQISQFFLLWFSIGQLNSSSVSRASTVKVGEENMTVNILMMVLVYDACQAVPL